MAARLASGGVVSRPTTTFVTGGVIKTVATINTPMQAPEPDSVVVKLLKRAGGCPRCSTFVTASMPTKVVSPRAVLEREGEYARTLTQAMPERSDVAELSWECGHRIKFPWKRDDLESMLNHIRDLRAKEQLDKPETIGFPELSFDPVRFDTAWVTDNGLSAKPRIGWRWCTLVYLEDPENKWSGHAWLTPDWRGVDPDKFHVRLASLNHREVWDPRTPLKAECRTAGMFDDLFDQGPTHKPPVKHCSCGIYTLADRDELIAARHAVPNGMTHVLVECALWGEVQTGERGDRAEKVYPMRIVVPALTGDWELSVHENRMEMMVDGTVEPIKTVTTKVSASYDMTRDSKLRRHVRENINIEAYKPLVDALQKTYGVPVELAPMPYKEVIVWDGGRIEAHESLPWLKEPSKQVAWRYSKDYELPAITRLRKLNASIQELEQESKKLNRMIGLFDHPLWCVAWLVWSFAWIWESASDGALFGLVIHSMVAAIWIFNLRRSISNRRKQRKSE